MPPATIPTPAVARKEANSPGTARAPPAAVPIHGLRGNLAMPTVAPVLADMPPVAAHAEQACHVKENLAQAF
eukprot:1620172-Alexandrium_andersonii.AAC.1